MRRRDRQSAAEIGAEPAAVRVERETLERLAEELGRLIARLWPMPDRRGYTIVEILPALSGMLVALKLVLLLRLG